MQVFVKQGRCCPHINYHGIIRYAFGRAFSSATPLYVQKLIQVKQKLTISGPVTGKVRPCHEVLLNLMMTSSKIETFSALLELCGGKPPVFGGFPLKCQWRGTLMFSFICAWTNGWANNRDAGDLKRHRAHCDGIVIWRILFNREHNQGRVIKALHMEKMFIKIQP